MNKKGTIQILRGIFVEHSSLLGSMITIYLIAALLNTFLTISVGRAITNHLHYTTASTIIKLAFFLISMAVVMSVCAMMRTFLFSKYEAVVIYRVQSKIMERLFNLPLSFFEGHTTGELCQRVFMIEPLARLSGQNQLGVLLSFVFSFISFLTMFYFSWKLTLSTLIIVGAYLLISIVNIKKQLPLIEKYMSNSGETAAFTFNMHNGMSRIKMFCCDAFAEAEWAKLYNQTRRKLSEIYGLGIWRFAMTSTILMFTLIITFFLMTTWESTQLPLEHYIIFYTALIQFMSSLCSFSMQFNEIAFSICAFRRLKPIWSTPQENEKAKSHQNKSFTEFKSAISFQNIQFNYPHSKLNILNGLTCCILKGEHVAIVGLSGAGKSTLLKLLLGLYTTEKGLLLIDQTPIQNLNLSELRQKIGVVFQDSKLMPGTLLTNIIGGYLSMTEEDAWRAADLVGLKEYIASLPMKMNTMVSDQVNLFSGGQKQLILIARALIAKPDILLLDEATHCLDAITQHTIAKVIRGLPITCISISHRLSTIQYTDKIMVLHQGRIIEEGSYDDLLEHRGLFYQLAQQQRYPFEALGHIPQELHRQRQESTAI